MISNPVDIPEVLEAFKYSLHAEDASSNTMSAMFRISPILSPGTLRRSVMFTSMRLPHRIFVPIASFSRNRCLQLLLQRLTGGWQHFVASSPGLKRIA